MNAKTIATIVLLLFVSSTIAQINLSGANIHIAAGSAMSIKGNITGYGNITGDGYFNLNGDSLQEVNLNGTIIPNLEVNNVQHIKLLSDLKIGQKLYFSSGKIKAGNNHVIFLAHASALNANDDKFIETNENGSVIKIIDENLSAFELPTGNGDTYHPLFVNTTGNYSNASIEVTAVSAIPYNKPLHINDYLSHYWKCKKSGINGNTIVFGKYDSARDISGVENHLKGYYFNGTSWSSANGYLNSVEHKTGTKLLSDEGLLYAMNKFVLLGSRAFLQGPYDADLGLMDDALRIPTLYLPPTDPYRTIDYAANFIHINNNRTEAVDGSPFTDQPNPGDNIVDWVFLELRNTAASPGNEILSTRSALIQRDGDIVDVDGKSPVTFNGINDGVYGLTVRHRNHLAMSLNPFTSDAYLNENKAEALSSRIIDLRTANPDEIFGNGDGYNTNSHPTLGHVKLMWAGNANGNKEVKYLGPYNDKSQILADLGKSEISILNGYFRSDLNMDGMVKFSGYLNDRSFLLSNVLSNEETAIIREQKPF